jgi:hypothetical protein
MRRVSTRHRAFFGWRTSPDRANAVRLIGVRAESKVKNLDLPITSLPYFMSVTINLNFQAGYSWMDRGVVDNVHITLSTILGLVPARLGISHAYDCMSLT